jgi:hypothetical protein
MDFVWRRRILDNLGDDLATRNDVRVTGKASAGNQVMFPLAISLRLHLVPVTCSRVLWESSLETGMRQSLFERRSAFRHHKSTTESEPNRSRTLLEGQ